MVCNGCQLQEDIKGQISFGACIFFWACCSSRQQKGFTTLAGGGGSRLPRRAKFLCPKVYRRSGERLTCGIIWPRKGGYEKAREICSQIGSTMSQDQRNEAIRRANVWRLKK